MNILADFSVAANAPQTFTGQTWNQWVPGRIRTAYWARKFGVNNPPERVQFEMAGEGEITRAELVAVIPDAVMPVIAAPDNPEIRTWGDAYRALSEEQLAAILAVIGRAYNTSARAAFEAALNAGTGAHYRAELLQMLRVYVRSIEPGFRPAGLLARASLFDPLTQAAQLGELNLKLAARWAAQMIEPGEKHAERAAALRAFAIKAGGNPAATDAQLSAVAAAVLAQMFTAQGVAMDDAVDQQRGLAANIGASERADKIAELRGDAISLSAAPVQGAQGLGDALKRLFRHPLKWARNVFEEVGKGAQALARNILDAEKNVPWLSQYLLKPLGFHAQASILNQLGRSLEDGSISTFDEKAVAGDAADTFTAAGQALLVAAPFLPPPFNVIAAAAGAVSLAAGMGINAALRDAEAKKFFAAQKSAAEAAGREAAAERAAINEEIEALESERRALEADGVAEAESAPRSTGPPRWLVPAAAGTAAVLALALFFGSKT